MKRGVNLMHELRHKNRIRSGLMMTSARIHKTWRFKGFYFRPHHIVCKLITSKESHQSVPVSLFGPLLQHVGFYKPHRFYPSASPLPYTPTVSQNRPTPSKACGLDLDILCLCSFLFGWLVFSRMPCRIHPMYLYFPQPLISLLILKYPY